MSGETERDVLKRARELIREEQYGRARGLLESIPDNETAQKFLERLDAVDPKPKSVDDYAEALEETRHELLEAEEDIQQQRGAVQRAMRVNTGILVFVGTLLGSLIGAAADFGGAVDTFDRFQTLRYPKLCIVGSDTILGEALGMADDWAADFSADHQVNLGISATGSGTGVRLAASGECAHVLAMSEPISERQEQELLDAGVELSCAAEIGYDIVVLVTDINNPIQNISTTVLSGMLLGRITNWSSLSTDFDYPVTILVREGSGTTDIVLRNIINFDSDGGTVFPPLANYEICDSNEDCLDRTLSTNGGLYWASASWIRTQPPQYLRVLPILEGDEAGINPLRDEVDLDRYPRGLQRPLYLYAFDQPSMNDEQRRLAREFVGYVRGVRGQQILEENFFFTHFDQPTRVRVPFPDGFDDIDAPGRTVCRDLN